MPKSKRNRGPKHAQRAIERSAQHKERVARQRAKKAERDGSTGNTSHQDKLSDTTTSFTPHNELQHSGSTTVGTIPVIAASIASTTATSVIPGSTTGPTRTATTIPVPTSTTSATSTTATSVIPGSTTGPATTIPIPTSTTSQAIELPAPTISISTILSLNCPPNKGYVVMRSSPEHSSKEQLDSKYDRMISQGKEVLLKFRKQATDCPANFYFSWLA
ncbi:hypothetical protein ACMFMG_008924 [Clarireedia jacksonii]